MIVHKNKFIFIHIPKTGGSSIQSLFDKCFYGWDEKNFLWKQHCTISQMQSIYNIDTNNYYKFSVIRNPWDRAVSDYTWLIQSFEFLKNTTLKDYLLIRNGWEKINHLNDGTGRGDHFYTQFSFIEIDGKNHMDRLVRFENLEKEFNEVCEEIGILPKKLPHKNKTKHAYYTEYYNNETRQIVAKKYAKDIEYFGYEFSK